MSIDLIHIAMQFVDRHMSAGSFSETYIKHWKQERDTGKLLQDHPGESEAMSSIFCVADLYNPDDDRKAYEFDEERLRTEVKKLLDALSAGRKA